MKTPTQRGRGRRPRPPRPKPKRKPDPFQFESLQDVPKGVRLRQYRGRTEVSIPTRQIFIGGMFALFAIGTALLSLVTLTGDPFPNMYAFLAFTAAVTMAFLILGLFHLFGNTKVEIDGTRMYHFRGFWGMGMRRSMPLRTIKSVGTKRKKLSARLPMGMAGVTDISEGQGGNVYLFIDGREYIESCKGARPKAVYYLKYFLTHHVRQALEAAKNH